jgi:hypothetical protein
MAAYSLLILFISSNSRIEAGNTHAVWHTERKPGDRLQGQSVGPLTLCVWGATAQQAMRRRSCPLALHRCTVNGLSHICTTLDLLQFDDVTAILNCNVVYDLIGACRQLDL